MAKEVSDKEREKIIAKFGKPDGVKKKKLKHPPKVVKEKPVSDGDFHEQPKCCKKSLIPNGKKHVVVAKTKVHVPKKIKIVPVKPIRVGSPVL